MDLKVFALLCSKQRLNVSGYVENYEKLKEKGKESNQDRCMAVYGLTLWAEHGQALRMMSVNSNSRGLHT